MLQWFLLLIPIFLIGKWVVKENEREKGNKNLVKEEEKNNNFSVEIFKFGGKIKRLKFFVNVIYLLICSALFIGLFCMGNSVSSIEMGIGLFGLLILCINLGYRRLNDIYNSKKLAIIFLILSSIVIFQLIFDKYLFVISVLIVFLFLLFKSSQEEKVEELKNFSCKNFINNYTILGFVSFCFLFYCIIMWKDPEDDIFQVVRWLVCSFSAWTACKIYKSVPKSFWFMIFVALSIVFNPVLAFNFDEDDIWRLINIITQIIFFVYLFKYLKRKSLIDL